MRRNFSSREIPRISTNSLELQAVSGNQSLFQNFWNFPTPVPCLPFNWSSTYQEAYLFDHPVSSAFLWLRFCFLIPSSLGIAEQRFLALEIQFSPQGSTGHEGNRSSTVQRRSPTMNGMNFIAWTSCGLFIVDHRETDRIFTLNMLCVSGSPLAKERRKKISKFPGHNHPFFGRTFFLKFRKTANLLDLTSRNWSSWRLKHCIKKTFPTYTLALAIQHERFAMCNSPWETQFDSVWAAPWMLPKENFEFSGFEPLDPSLRKESRRVRNFEPLVELELRSSFCLAKVA